MSEKKILIIDDQPEIIEVIQELIELDCAGSIIDSCLDAKDALDFLDKNIYKVICSDLNMPIMGGLDLIAKIRSEDNPNRNTPVIVITGGNDDLTVVLSKFENVKQVNKAENIPELLEMIKEFLDR